MNDVRRWLRGVSRASLEGDHHVNCQIGAGIGLAAALLLGAGPALAASWTVVPAPPTGQNANMQGVSAPSDTSAWAVGNGNGAANTGIGSHALIDHWNGTSWSQATVPAITGSVKLQAVSSSGTSDSWHEGDTRPGECRANRAPAGGPDLRR
jgi:hypothetical protein